MTDFAGESRYAIYRRFSIGDESQGFKLLVEDYQGTAGWLTNIYIRYGFHYQLYWIYGTFNLPWIHVKPFASIYYKAYKYKYKELHFLKFQS